MGRKSGHVEVFAKHRLRRACFASRMELSQTAMLPLAYGLVPSNSILKEARYSESPSALTGRSVMLGLV